MTTRRNRGKESGDNQLFGSEKILLKLYNAIADMHYLLSRGYGEKAAAELVGNRYKLTSRQIQMIKGASASDVQIKHRNDAPVEGENLKDKTVFLDGFNVLILLESMLSQAFIFKGVDGYYRDLSSVHGSYKRVIQTEKSIELVAAFFKKMQLAKMIWVFDKPVSNSGRIKQMLLDFAIENEVDWEVILENNPDRFIVEHAEIAITSDALILDRCKHNFNLMQYIISNEKLEINLIDTTKKCLI